MFRWGGSTRSGIGGTNAGGGDRREKRNEKVAWGTYLLIQQKEQTWNMVATTLWLLVCSDNAHRPMCRRVCCLSLCLLCHVWHACKAKGTLLLSLFLGSWAWSLTQTHSPIFPLAVLLSFELYLLMALQCVLCKSKRDMTHFFSNFVARADVIPMVDCFFLGT